MIEAVDRRTTALNTASSFEKPKAVGMTSEFREVCARFAIARAPFADGLEGAVAAIENSLDGQ